jgi:hypothetical protein
MIIDLESWEAGYEDGLVGRPSRRAPGLDQLSYSGGYFQACSCRAGTHEDSQPHETRLSTQRVLQPYGGTRLIII